VGATYASPRIFQIPVAFATERVPTTSLHCMKMIARVSRTTSQCASTNSLSRTASMNCIFSSMVACGLLPEARSAVMPMA